MTAGNFGQPSCIAEELALRLPLCQVIVNFLLFGLLGEAVSDALGAFADNVFEDMDHEWLYDDRWTVSMRAWVGSTLAMAPMSLGARFSPFNEGGYVHPTGEIKPGSSARVVPS
ncbi:hypothetical protein [Streptomyces sp. NPDC002104]